MFASLMKKTAVTAIGLLIAPAVWAAQYKVTVDGQLLNDVTPTIYGLSQSTAAHLVFTVDTSLGTIQSLPAGTVLTNDNSTMPVNGKLVPASAITNLSFTLGSASWTEADVQTITFPAGQSFGLIVLGDLVDGSHPVVYMQLSNSAGTIDVGGYSCAPELPCSFGNSGVAQGVSGDYGSLVNVQAAVTALSKTVSEQITDVVEVIDVYTNIDKGTKTSLTASLGGALDALDPTLGVNIGAALNKMDAFLNKVKAQAGKKLTIQQANDLIASANKIKNVLYSM